MFSAIYREASEAGEAACNSAIPRPMIVNGDGTLYYVSEGLCGFAWIRFSGTTPFARWAKKMGYASKAYPKGMQVWVHSGGQSIARKEAYAHAFAAVLKKHGIECYADSRLD